MVKELVLNMEKISVLSVKIAYNKIAYERDLYFFLIYMVFYNENLKCYMKIIFYEESLKLLKGMDRWFYLDMVGVRFLYVELFNENLIVFFKKFDILFVKVLN